MARALKLEFGSLQASSPDVLVLFCEEGIKFAGSVRQRLDSLSGQIKRAASAERFKGKSGSALELAAPGALDVSRLIIIGVGRARDLKSADFVKLGGIVMGRIPASAK